MDTSFSLIMSVYNKIKVSDLIDSLKSIGNQSFKAQRSNYSFRWILQY